MHVNTSNLLVSPLRALTASREELSRVGWQSCSFDRFTMSSGWCPIWARCRCRCSGLTICCHDG